MRFIVAWECILREFHRKTRLNIYLGSNVIATVTNTHYAYLLRWQMPTFANNCLPRDYNIVTGGLSAIDITVECTLSWRVRSNIRFLSAWAGGVLQILRSDWYREWTVFSRPARSQHAVSNPLRVESPRTPYSFYKEIFRSRHLADISFINSLFSPSLSLSLTLSQITLDSFKKLVSKWILW